jgi:hypothetical protein
VLWFGDHAGTTTAATANYVLWCPTASSTTSTSTLQKRCTGLSTTTATAWRSSTAVRASVRRSADDVASAAENTVHSHTNTKNEDEGNQLGQSQSKNGSKPR